MKYTYQKSLLGMVVTMMLVLSFSSNVLAHPNPAGCEEAAAAVKKAQMEYNEARKAFFAVEDKVKKKRSEIKSLERIFSSMEKASGQALSELDDAMADKATCDEYESNPDGIPPLFDCSDVPERIQLAKEKVDAAERAIQEVLSRLEKAEAELAQLEDEMSIAFQRKEAAARALKQAQEAYAALGCHIHV